MTPSQTIAAHIAVCMANLAATIEAFKCERPSSAWPRKVTPQTVATGWQQWATAAANHEMGA